MEEWSIAALNYANNLLLQIYSLVLLVIEAGIDIDLTTLKLIGTRGFMIAFFGSILPIALGMLIAFVIGVDDTKGKFSYSIKADFNHFVEQLSNQLYAIVLYMSTFT